MERAVFLFVWCCLPLQGLEATPPEGVEGKLHVLLPGWRLECLALGRVMKWLYAMSAASMDITRSMLPLDFESWVEASLHRGSLSSMPPEKGRIEGRG
ncbi:unnamed protein product, partial [Symbiodinium microadriaticum]